jgi:hypothetical protein
MEPGEHAPLKNLDPEGGEQIRFHAFRIRTISRCQSDSCEIALAEAALSHSSAICAETIFHSFPTCANSRARILPENMAVSPVCASREEVFMA